MPIYSKTNESTPLTNFNLIISDVYENYAKDKSNPNIIYKMSMDFEDNKGGTELSVPQSNLKQFDWEAHDPRANLNPVFSEAHARRHIAAHIRSLAQDLPVKIRYLVDRTGWHQFREVRFYFTGSDILRPNSEIECDFEIIVDSMSNNMDFDFSLSEGETVAKMMELISLNPHVGRILMSHTLMYLLRPAYIYAWRAPRSSVFIHGETGTKKTSYASLLTQTYNRSEGLKEPKRLNTSIAAAIEILYSQDDCTIVLDDLFPADSSRLKAEQEQTLEEITRIVGDGTARTRMKGNNLNEKGPPTCGVVFTGEYLYGTGSSAARILAVAQSPNIDCEKLKYFQDNLLIVSTFYRYFLEWHIQHYDEHRKYLKKWFDVYCKTKIDIHDRLSETHYFFNTTYCLFLDYCSSRGFISEDNIKKLHCSFKRLLMSLVIEQDKRVGQNSYNNAYIVDYLTQIRELYKKGNFLIAESYKSYDKNLHDGLIHNFDLCIRGEQLSKRFPNVTLAEIGRSLKAQGALKSSKGGHTSQIYPLNNLRVYAIPLSMVD